MALKLPNRKSRIEQRDDLGLGTGIENRNQRFLNQDGSFNVKRTGLPSYRPYDLYNYLITVHWSHFWLLVLSTYVSFNLLFATLYMIVGLEQLENVHGLSGFEKFAEAFFFSCQTFTTVGYGRINPNGMASGLISSLESMIGLLTFALATGLLYGRFSRPNARILFSNHALISPYRGGRGLMFRIANQRRNQLIEVEAQLALSLVMDVDGKPARQFFDLPLERSKINFFSLNWTIVHPINENSPLFGLTPEQLKVANAEFMILLKAFDDAFSTTVHARSSYKPHEVVWGARFQPMFHRHGTGAVLELEKINDHEPAELPSWPMAVTVEQELLK